MNIHEGTNLNISDLLTKHIIIQEYNYTEQCKTSPVQNQRGCSVLQVQLCLHQP